MSYFLSNLALVLSVDYEYKLTEQRPGNSDATRITEHLERTGNERSLRASAMKHSTRTTNRQL